MIFESRHASQPGCPQNVVAGKQTASLLMLILLISAAPKVWPGEPVWEYKIVILQGVTAGGTIDREPNGVYVDTKRTRTLNRLAQEGWELVAVVGAVATDHSVYLRRKIEP